MLEKSKEIKFGKPGRSKAKKGTVKGRRRRQKGDTYLEKSKKGNMTAQELADYDKRLADAGDSRGYLGEDRAPEVYRYDNTDSTSTNKSNVSNRMKELRSTDKAGEEAAKKLKAEKADQALVDRRGKSREEKQNTPQGAGGGAKSNVDKIGSSTEDDEFKTGAKKVKAKSATSKLLNKLSKTEGAKKEPKKSNSYADAKKKDPKLDSYIKIRSNSEKGSSEYNAAQNKINAAYGKGPQRRVDVKKVEVKKTGQIERKSTPDRSIKTASKPAPKSASASSNKNNTGGGSGMRGVQSEKNKLKNLGITTESDTKLPPSLSNKEKRQKKREGKKTIQKEARNKIRELKGKPAKAGYGRMRNQKGTEKKITSSIRPEYQGNYTVNGENLKPPAGTTYNKYTNTSDAPSKLSQNKSVKPKVPAKHGMAKHGRVRNQLGKDETGLDYALPIATGSSKALKKISKKRLDSQQSSGNRKFDEAMKLKIEEESGQDPSKKIVRKPRVPAKHGTAKYGKGGRKRAFVGLATGALTGAMNSIGSGEGAKGMLTGAFKGAANSVIPGVGTALGNAPTKPFDKSVAQGTIPDPNAPSVPAAPAGAPAPGANPNAPVDPAAPATAPNPNAVVQGKKGKMIDRRAKAKKGKRKNKKNLY